MMWFYKFFSLYSGFHSTSPSTSNLSAHHQHAHKTWLSLSSPALTKAHAQWAKYAQMSQHTHWLITHSSQKTCSCLPAASQRVVPPSTYPPTPTFTYISSPLSPTPTGPPLHPPHPPLPHFIPITTASIHHGHLQRNNLCRRKFSGIRWVSERSHISHGSDAHLSSYLHLCSQPMTISLLKWWFLYYFFTNEISTGHSATWQILTNITTWKHSTPNHMASCHPLMASWTHTPFRTYNEASATHFVAPGSATSPRRFWIRSVVSDVHLTEGFID